MAPNRMQYTESRAEPLAGALDEDGRDVVIELAADHLLLALEVQAERDGVGHHRWDSQTAVYVGQTHEGLAYFIAYGGPRRRVSRKEMLAFVRERKAGLAE